MANVTQIEGVLSHVDNEGNVIEMYPQIKTDAFLREQGKAADAATVGDKLSRVLYIESFDSSTGTLVTKSADYTG